MCASCSTPWSGPLSSPRAVTSCPRSSVSRGSLNARAPPARRASTPRVLVGQGVAGLLLAMPPHGLAELLVLAPHDGGGEQGGVHGTGPSDGQRPHRNPGRHLD